MRWPQAAFALLLAVVPARGDELTQLVRADARLREKLAEAKAAKDVPKPYVKGAPYLRLPTWELGAIVAQRALGTSSSPLTEREKAIARWVFGEGTIDLESVRVIFAPSPTGTPMAWGNTIRVPAGFGLSTGTLAHELTHVWQYQTSGTEYISDSFLKQACAFLIDGDRDEAYRYSLVEGKSFFAYGAEQQAEIVEAYAISRKKREDPRYQKLLGDLRSRRAPARVTALDAALMMEKDAGLPSRWHALPPGPAGEPRFNGEAGGVPQVEVRF